MDHHVLSLLTISIFFFLTTSPLSHCQEEGTKFSLCSRPYTCGKVSNIYYPFWGQNRPSYCASTVQLKLNCEEPNQQTNFQLDSQNFTVLKIDALYETMRLVRTDIVYDDCSSDLTNTSLSSIFKFPETVHNVTVFYGCPSGFSFGERNFTCKNDRTQFGFYAEMTDELSAEFPELEQCELRIHVPIFREFSLVSDGGIDSLKEAASRGFDVYYSVTDGKKCRTCEESKGFCGSMEISKNQFACHCSDGSEDLECYAYSANHSSMFSYPCYIFVYISLVSYSIVRAWFSDYLKRVVRPKTWNTKHKFT
ncbi:hypothetical protein V8G54_012533 [Vigna mungo]|uniref:non-specific serine/threonine protein kinase n=1 Tax=Vigna mungo TaxID=3915 RepID=A0AAQ3NTU5_VIGMU